MIRYIAEITNGDTYHKSGETYVVSESEVDKVLKEGYRIFESKCGPDGAQIYYPCKVYKREYKMVSEEIIGATCGNNIKTDFCEDNDPNWWMDHWC